MSSSEATDPGRDTWIDRVIDGRYRITEHIGRGGMGTVYKVVHTQIGKVAALKLLHGNLTGDKELIKRFHREAEAISRLNHPNIVQVFDFGRVGETVFLVMEYLKGEDLATILRRDGPIPFERAAPILIQVCDALTEAHDLGIIHRDLKPENVRVARTRDGSDFIKVMDFGLAKMLMEDEKDPAITARGNLVGTPYYMAPELIRAKPVDGRADIYSLGAMAYRMLTGENAFIANTPVGVLTKHITDELVPPSQRAPEQELNEAIDGLVLKAMAKERDERYPHAVALKRDLLDLLGQQSPPGQISGAYRPWSSGGSMVITPTRRASDSFTQSERVEIGELPTGRVDEDAVSADVVLSKEDLAFEKRLHRNRLVKPLLALPVLAAAAFAVYWFAMRDGELIAPPNEIEPNNGPQQATPLARGKPVTGHLGKRISAGESDRDWYSIKIDGSGPQTVYANVGPIPNMDTCVELYDATGGRITGADSASTGGGEVLTNWTVDPGRYYLLVREVWDVGGTPTENVTDPYTLFARWRPHEKGWEMEPNDRPNQEMEIECDQPVRGYLGAVDDRDRFKVVTARAGKLSGSVTAVKGVDLVLDLFASNRTEAVTFDSAGRGELERFDDILSDGKQPVVVVIRRKVPGKAKLVKKAPGIEVPYTLKVNPPE
jgi:serine/threonine-protein kinase